MKKRILLCLPLFLMSFSSLSNEVEKTFEHPRHWWVNWGGGVIGAKNPSSDKGYSTRAIDHQSFNGMLTDNLFVTFFYNFSNGFYSQDVLYSEKQDFSISDFGVMMGYRCKHPKWYWSAATGLSAYKYQYDTEYQVVRFTPELYATGYGREEETTLSLPLQFQLFRTPFKHFGYGLIGHVGVNKNPYAAVMLAIQFA